MNPQQDNHAAAGGLQPAPDTTPAHDATTPAAPSTLPSPTTSFPPVAATSNEDHTAPAATSAPTVNDDDDDDTAGDYIMTDPPHAAATTPAVSTSVSPTSSATEPAPDTDDLLELKQGALQQLSPLLDHLDQTPEEKFRTTMMMIQATDNHAMLKTAYEAAQKIEDEKVRAQALLDVVNEINYFTQQDANDAGQHEEAADQDTL